MLPILKNVEASNNNNKICCNLLILLTLAQPLRRDR